MNDARSQWRGSAIIGIAAGVLLALSAALLPVVYRLIGAPAITDAYNGRSWPFLNRMAALRSHRTLDEFHIWAGRLVAETATVLFATGAAVLAYSLYRRYLSARETGQSRFVTAIDRSVLVAGMAVSLIGVWLTPNGYHALDVATFFDWQAYLASSLATLYAECETCNYPVLGTLLSAGILHGAQALVADADAAAATQVFRVLLALVDGINVYLVFRILGALAIRRAALWAGVIGLVPSSWVGAAVWAQIDGITQFFVLAFVLLQVRFVLARCARQDPATHSAYAHGALSGLLLAATMLTKQLAIFSVPVLGFFALVIVYCASPSTLARQCAAILATFVVGTVICDPFLVLPDGYWSHLLYIFLGGGSDHGDKIAGNGFNIWVLLGRDSLSSSSEPFLGRLTPKMTGAGVFLAAEAVFFGALGWLGLRTQRKPLTLRDGRRIALMCLFLLSLTNLAFNVLISGTHERYLFHFFPYIFIAWLGLDHRSQLASDVGIGALLLASVFYGRFVWGVLSPNAIAIPEEIAALWHLCMFVVLAVLFIAHIVRATVAMDLRRAPATCTPGDSPSRPAVR